MNQVKMTNHEADRSHWPLKDFMHKKVHSCSNFWDDLLHLFQIPPVNGRNSPEVKAFSRGRCFACELCKLLDSPQIA